MSYFKQIGRVSVGVTDNGLRDHNGGHGAAVSCVAGWNDSCPTVTHTMSVDELRDLRYLLDRAIVAAESTAGVSSDGEVKRLLKKYLEA